MSAAALAAAGVFSFVIALVTTPLARRVARAWRWLDRSAERKFHRRPTALLGGAAIVPALLAPVLWVGGARLPSLLAATALLFGVGLWDDRRDLGVTAKLAAQLATAALLVTAGWRLALPLPAVTTAVLTAVWIVAIVNACNLLDNMDGILASVAAVAAAGFLLLLPSTSPATTMAATMAAATLGATLGFLPYNVPRASIFMGDAGSHTLGLWLALLGVELSRTAEPAVAGGGWPLALLVLAVPIVDTATVVVSRLRRGRNPLTTPGTDHLSHRLHAAGAGDAGTILLLVLAGALGSALALFLRG